MSNNQLAIRDDIPLSELGGVLVKSGFFQDSKDVSQAIVKVLAGKELGFGPIASMTGVNIIKGRVSLSANLIASAIKRTRYYNYRIIKLTDKECELAFFENGQEVGRSSFTAEDAKRAGLAGGDNWTKYPRNMLFARAISNGAKWYCPDVFGGPVYTPDELGAVIDGETGEVIDAPVVTVHEPQPEPPAPPTNGHEKPQRPYPASVVKDGIARKAEKHQDFKPNDKQQNLLRYGLDLCFAGDPAAEDKRHTLLDYLTGHASTKDVTGQQFKAIVEDWLKMEQDSGGEYTVDAFAAKEAQAIVTAALVGEGQQSLL
jgi:hypothetical protein